MGSEDVRCRAFIILCLMPLIPGFSLNLELDWQSESPSDSPVTASYSSWLIGVYVAILSFLQGCWGILTQAFMLAQQVLLPTETSSQSNSKFYLFFFLGLIVQNCSHNY